MQVWQGYFMTRLTNWTRLVVTYALLPFLFLSSMTTAFLALAVHALTVTGTEQ
jgi:hypothetical protein